MKKKILAVVLAAVCMFAFAACGGSEESEQSTEPQTQAEQQEETGDEAEHRLTINNEPYCVTPDECDARGVECIICDATDKYSFKAVNNGDTDVTWKVYILDKKFEDATRYIEDSETPALEGDGQLEVKEGQYIYVVCSANEFTTDPEDMPKDAWLEINYADEQQ